MSSVLSVIAILLAVAVVWWLATGLLLHVAQRFPAEGVKLKGLVAAILLAGLSACLTSRGMATLGGVCLGFFGALALWAVHEMAFLAGWLTGPRRVAASASDAPRLREAIAAISDRQIAIFITACGLGLLLLESANSMALWTFLTLWVLRLLTEVNLFLGAPHAPTALLPQRLAYLTTYFRKDRVSSAFPLTLNLVVGALIILSRHGVHHPDAEIALAMHLLASLVFLGIVELFFLIIPFDESCLWRWADNGQHRVHRTSRRHRPHCGQGKR